MGVCQIAVAIEPTDRYPEDKIAILERAGVRREARFDLEARPDMDLDPSLVRFLRHLPPSPSSSLSQLMVTRTD